MITSKITRRARTTIPQPVRKALRASVGDTLTYKIGRGHVILTKAPPAVADDRFATFSEWDSENDAKAYAGL